MGCEVSCGANEITVTRTAWMVVHMCSKWFNKERDTDSDGHYQNSIDASALQSADAEWPHDVLPIYAKYLKEHFESYASELHKIRRGNLILSLFEIDFRRDLLEARDFITMAAASGESASVSH